MAEIFLTSHALQRGKGAVWSIMAEPRDFERIQSYGQVRIGVPQGREVPMMHAALYERRQGGLFAGTEKTDLYRKTIETRWARSMGLLAPGKLVGTRWDQTEIVIPTGAILCCSCGAGQPCHRYWFAEFLRKAGWTVTTDHTAGER